MRSSWESLRAGLTGWLETREARHSFERLRSAGPALSAHAHPSDLVDALVHESDLVEKDRVLRLLIVAVSDRRSRRLAQALLLLCLWPGLDAIFRRRLFRFQCDGQDLAAEIVNRFTECVQRIDLGRVRRITATLVRNTEREVVDARRRETELAGRALELTGETADPSTTSAGEAPFGIPCRRWDTGSVATLRAWLKQAVGSDADLVIDAVVLDRSGHQLARSYGISHAAARKRLGRALVRARRSFIDDQSQTAPAARFC